MRLTTVLMATLVSAVVTACALPAAPPPSAGPTSSGPTASGPSASATPTSTLPALGAWTAGCSSPDADGAALVANLVAQPEFGGTKTPSAAPGWPDALAAAVKPLDECPTAHLIAVGKIVAFGDDAQARATASAAIIGLAKGRTLQLTGTQIGRITRGTSEASATPVLTAILGTPKTSLQSCEASGQDWSVLAWGDFHVSFLKAGKNAALDTWSITPTGATPANLTLPDGLPLQATFAQLKALKADLVQVDVFDTGGGPWVAEVRQDLRYHWTDRSGRSIRVEGGPLRGCE